jgi:hypothetical protein
VILEEDEEEALRKDTPPGGPGSGDRSALRDSSHKPRLKMFRPPKFACCNPQKEKPDPPAVQYQAPPSPEAYMEKPMEKEQQPQQFQEPPLPGYSKETQTSEESDKPSV